MIASIVDPSQVSAARRAAADFARASGFDETATGRIALVATEMATNLLKHAAAGEIVIDNFADRDGTGLELLSLDKGPGIADVGLALADGFSTAGSPGNGLGAVRRQCDQFAIWSRPGLGTAAVARFQRQGPSGGVALGAVMHACPGEPVSGDGWAFGAAAAGPTTPAAALLDIVLVGEESWRFLIEMKQRPLTEHIPIIVLSSLQDERKARSLGADDYLAKPVGPQALIRALDELTGGRSVTKVLAVDDEEVSRYLVRQLLPRGAFALSEASNGLDGLKRAQDDRPDVVLLDLKMPGMDGFEFLDRLTQIDGMRSVPAIVLTSMRLGADERRRLGRAAQSVIKSELSADVLVSAIRHAMGGRVGTA